MAENVESRPTKRIEIRFLTPLSNYELLEHIGEGTFGFGTIFVFALLH
jgi:hypothetical protein